MVKLFRRSFSRTKGADADSGAAAASPDNDLDVDFYRAFHEDLADFDEKAAKTHWERHGRVENRPPNARSALLGRPDFDLLPADFSAVGYVALNCDLGRSFHNPIAATRHFLEYGMAEGRRYRDAPDDTAFMRAFARQIGNRDAALSFDDPRLRWTPGTLGQYLRLAGFEDDAFLADFNERFYAAVAMLPQIGEDMRLSCLFHFAEVGAELILPISETLLFDPAFHRRTLVEEGDQASARLDNAKLYRRWLSRRRFESHPPNSSAMMMARFGVACASDAVVYPPVYRFANRDLAALDDDALLAHVFRDGLVEQRSSIRITEANAAVLTQHADYLAMQGKTEEAERLYSRLVHFVPAFQQLNQHFGDHLLRKGAYAAAYTCFRRNILTGRSGRWAYLNAAECCEKLNDLKGAFIALDEGHRAYPEDQNIRRRRDAMSDRHFADEYAFARAQALAGDVSGAQRHLEDAVRRCDGAFANSAPPRPIRTIALFANMDLPQCVLYRVEQKIEQLTAAGFEVLIYDCNRDNDTFRRDLPVCDAVIFYRVAAFPPVVRAIHAAHAAGLPTFYDLDDLVFDAASFPEPLESYSGNLTHAQHVDIALGVPLFCYAMGLCEYGIASTKALAERMGHVVRSRRCFVHINGLGLRHEEAMERYRTVRRSDGPVTIFYGSGTKAHKQDFETILLPAFKELHHRFGSRVRFVVAGHRPLGGEAGDVPIHYEDFDADIDRYWSRLSEADICLSVLHQSIVTDAKSEIKWLEGAMFAVPAVVSKTATFVDVVENGVDGFVVDGTAGFVEALSRLVIDGRLRKAMGKAAAAKAQRLYSIDALSQNLRIMLASIEHAQAHRIRVLVVHVFFPPQTKGGATRVVIDNIADLRESHGEEFEFEVFTTLEGGTDPYQVEISAHKGVRVTAMVTPERPNIDVAPQDERAGEVFRRCVERFGPDVIHFHCIQRITASAVEVAAKLHIPYLITVHDGWWICDSQFMHGSDGPVRTYDFRHPRRHRGGAAGVYDRPSKLLPALEGAAAILAVSEPFAELHRSTGLANVRTVANGLPRAGARFDGAGRRPGRSSHARLQLGHIGGMEEHKGLPLLKCALIVAEPSNLALTVVDLSLEPGEEVLEMWHRTPVRIIARRRPEEMQALYDGIDVVVAPSLWPESYGLVTREALAAGCWVVASDRGAIGEPVIEDVNGHIVNVDNVDGLVKLLRRLDAEAIRYKTSPPPREMRSSADQAAELAALYREVTQAGRAYAREAGITDAPVTSFSPSSTSQ